MSDKLLKQESERWLVYTRLGQYRYSEQNWFAERRFTTYEDAEAFLYGPSHDWPDSAKRREDGWRGPIKAKALSVGGRSFAGPWLRDALKISKSDKIETYDQMYEAWWESTGADAVPYVMAQMDSEGLLEKTDDLTGHPAHTDEQKKQVQLRADKYKRPEIECFLDSGWNFFEIRTNAKRRLGYVNPDEETGYEHRLFAAALDLEAALREQYARLTAIDVFHFWTSFDVWVDLAAFCRKTLWNGREDQATIEAALRRFCRILGGYAHSIRSGPGEGAGAEVLAPENVTSEGSKSGKRRGRPPNIERRDAIRNAVKKQGEHWRDHLDEICKELDSQEVPLGGLQDTKIQLDDALSSKVSKWGDLELAVGEQRAQILDTLRKYAERRI